MQQRLLNRSAPIASLLELRHLFALKIKEDLDSILANVTNTQYVEIFDAAS